ncbi:hypothetical protein J6590_061617 [Homalodisca vitripennis]|nr:hypothetical protein J6590_061617 [Homalodisca vitripennis]
MKVRVRDPTLHTRRLSSRLTSDSPDSEVHNPMLESSKEVIKTSASHHRQSPRRNMTVRVREPTQHTRRYSHRSSRAFT